MIYACIVLYNKRLGDSATYQSLEKNDYKGALIIFDNSTDTSIRVFNKYFCSENKITYLEDDKLHNAGLSQAYNAAVRYLRHNGSSDKDYLITFDDDTTVTKEYCDSVLKSAEKPAYQVLVPVVYSNQLILSPSNIAFGCKVVIIKSLDEINLAKITGINSGLCVRLDVFNKIHYNEKLFLDSIDHCFFEDLRRGGFTIKILPNAVLYQSYSQLEKNNKESRLARLRITFRDNHAYADGSLNKNIFFRISNLITAKKLDREYGTSEFTEVYHNIWK